MSETYVLDSFALLAWLQDEKGAAKVDHLVGQAKREHHHLCLSLINLGEVYYITQRERGRLLAQHALTIIENLPIRFFSADRTLTLRAAELKAGFPIAYADAFTAALGIMTNGIVVTGDPEFNLLKDMIKIEWLK